jgi:branched-chain amino acid transport system permease protein
MEYYVAVLLAIGVHMLLGLSVYLVAITGQVSFGQQGFYAIGAYLAGMCTAMWGVPFVLAILVGMLAAGVVGVLVGFPALRVRGLYLGVATFGFGEIVRFSFLNVRYQKQIGGKLVGPDKWEGFRHITYIFDRGWSLQQYLLVIYGAVLVVVILVALLERSKLGAMFRAVEEDEVAAAMVGINVTAVKVFAFALGALVAGLAGALFVHYSTYIDHDMVALPLAVASVTYPMLGGLGSFWGAIIAAAFLMFLTESLRFLQEFRMIIYGSLIILTMTFRPRGIIDEALIGRLKGLWKRPALPADARRVA